MPMPDASTRTVVPSHLAAFVDPCSSRQFVPGPVPIDAHLLAIGDQQLPYSRTETLLWLQVCQWAKGF